MLAGGKRLKENDPVFRGYKPAVIWNGRVYKYIICISESLEDVKKKLREVKGQFEGCFVVEIKESELL